MIDLHRLYPQYRVVHDRRTQSVPVENDRRSGIDRRAQDRVKLDTNLTRDIFEIRSKVSQMQKPESTPETKAAFTQNSEKAALNTLKTDQFVKVTKNEPSENIKQDKKSDAPAAALAFGVLATVMGGVIGASLMGPAGAVVAVGLGVYFGGKLFKQGISNHMKDKQ